MQTNTFTFKYNQPSIRNLEHVALSLSAHEVKLENYIVGHRFFVCVYERRQSVFMSRELHQSRLPLSM